MKTMLLKSRSVLVCAGALLLGSMGCETVDDVVNPKLPAATQEGKDTFGCLADGKLWLPYHPNPSSPFPGDFTVRANSFPINSSVFTIEARNLREGNAGVTGITLFIRSTTAVKPGVYTLSNGFSAGATLGAGSFHTDNVGTGTITITKVEPYTITVNGITSHQSIVSGTFGFTAGGAGTANGQTLTVTEGRFDWTPMQ